MVTPRQLVSRFTLGLGFFAALVHVGSASAEVIVDFATRSTINKLMSKWAAVNDRDLSAMVPLPVKKFTLPDRGIDVLRAIVEERYDIDGVGSDTVVLHGWIAVMHDTPHLIKGATDLRWGSAKIDTEFVGLSLKGQSKIFGDVYVELDPKQRSLGVVGAWPEDEVPEQAKVLEGLIQLAQDQPKTLPGFGGVEILVKPTPNGNVLTPQLPDGTDLSTRPQILQNPNFPKNANYCSLAYAAAACKCAANLNVRVSLANLGLTMTTDHPVYMFSHVETIPPVGYTASVTLTPVLSGNGCAHSWHVDQRNR